MKTQPIPERHQVLRNQEFLQLLAGGRSRENWDAFFASPPTREKVQTMQTAFRAQIYEGEHPLAPNTLNWKIGALRQIEERFGTRVLPIVESARSSGNNYERQIGQTYQYCVLGGGKEKNEDSVTSIFTTSGSRFQVHGVFDGVTEQPGFGDFASQSAAEILTMAAQLGILNEYSNLSDLLFVLKGINEFLSVHGVYDPEKNILRTRHQTTATIVLVTQDGLIFSRVGDSPLFLSFFTPDGPALGNRSIDESTGQFIGAKPALDENKIQQVEIRLGRNLLVALSSDGFQFDRVDDKEAEYERRLYGNLLPCCADFFSGTKPFPNLIGLGNTVDTRFGTTHARRADDTALIVFPIRE